MRVYEEIDPLVTFVPEIYSVFISASARTIPRISATPIEFVIVKLEEYDPCIYGHFTSPVDVLPDINFRISNVAHQSV
jgi:hypothetical protein